MEFAVMSHSSQTMMSLIDAAQRNLKQAEQEVQNALRSLGQTPPGEAQRAVHAAKNAISEAQQVLQAIAAVDSESESLVRKAQDALEDVDSGSDDLTDLETREVFTSDERLAPTLSQAGVASNDLTVPVAHEELEDYEAETERAAEDQALFESDALRFVGTMAATPDGDDLGEVQELILGPDGIVQGILLSIKGSEGLAERQVTIQWDETEVSADGRVVINMSLEDLQQLPAPE
jgi:PRC-barrel domain